MVPSIYIDLEDDVSKIVARIKKERASEVILVCPKRCFLFNDSINLRLLKKQLDMMKKTVSILTMDEKGQLYAKEAGFSLKFLPNLQKKRMFSDISQVRIEDATHPTKEEKHLQDIPSAVFSQTVKEFKNAAKVISKKISEPLAKKTEDKFILSRTSPKLLVNDNIFPEEIKNVHKAEKSSSSWKKIILAFFILCLITAGLLYVVILPKAEVTVFPKSENLVRDLEISATTAVPQPDVSKLILPATKISEEMEVSKNLESQGKKEVGNKASGSIRIYNFTKQTLNLKAATTIITLDSKNYVLAADAMQLKPTGYKNAKTKEIDPNTLSDPVEIIAAEGSEDYNLPAGTRMEITNQVFGSKPTLLYAKTETPISGGTSRYLSVISDQDITNAQETLKASALESLNGKLSANNLELIEGSYVAEVEQFSTDKPAATQTPNFQAYLKIKFTGLAINPAQLKQLVYDRINQTLASNKTLNQGDGTDLAYKFKNFDTNNDLGVLNVHYQGSAQYNLDGLENYLKQFINKTPEQVNEILSQNSEIDRIDIVLAPSWQKRFPFFANKIKINQAK